MPAKPLADGKQTTLKLFSIEATADTSKLPLGSWTEMSLERIGEETVETPAGRFDSVHYRLAGFSDVWIHGPDRLMVKMQVPARDLEYLLVRLRRDDD